MYWISQRDILLKVIKTLFCLFSLLSTKIGNLLTEKQPKLELYSATLSMISFVLVKCYKKILENQKIQPWFIFDNLYKSIIISIINIIVFKIAYKSATGKGISILGSTAFCNTKFISLFFYSVLNMFFGRGRLLSLVLLLFMLANYFSYIYKGIEHLSQEGTFTEGFVTSKKKVVLSTIDTLFCFILLLSLD